VQLGVSMQYRHSYTGLILWCAATLALAADGEPGPGEEPEGGVGMVTTADGNAYITNNAAHTFAAAHLDSDTYTGAYSIPVQDHHQGRLASVYLGATLNGQWYIATPSGWAPWKPQSQPPTALGEKLLQETVEIGIVDQEFLPPGEIEIHAAYQVDGEPAVIGEHPLQFSVLPADEDFLHPFQSAEALTDFLRQGLENSASDPFYATVDLAEADAGQNAVQRTATVSTTNLQEQGVDEADIIKADEQHLLLLRDCQPKTCVATFELDSDNALASEVGSTELSGELSASGMYLVQDDNGGDRLITIGSNPGYALWLDVWGWSGNSTELEFFDASDPGRLESLDMLTLDGSLIASRRVGDRLFLVTRYTPFLEGYIPYAYDDEALANNANLLAELDPTDLLPKVRDSQQQEQPLISAENCYLPTSNIDQAISPSIITVTVVPLNDPAGFTSTCFVGDSETLYMTPESLYLATTQFEYANTGFDRLFYQPEHTTAVHKFDLLEQGIEYRGSGQVKGHLGWSEDKKSFRMGENGDYLNVVTSVGQTWDGSSSSMLTVLKESESGNRLEIVDTVEGIGKPGEQLYAARFLGDRAYLVTFLLTDPLYVIDLSDQENPRIAGELEIDGYSDYLHPVSDSLLLGIGKDAVADETSMDFNGTRGAWYQGVKLSLFDVADPAAPKELDSLVLGERGTQSEVLYDHHALAFLPPTETAAARIAIPVDLHDTVPPHEWFDPESPSALYDYTHTALYSFEITDQRIDLAGLIYGARAAGGSSILPVGFFNYFGDRALLVNDAVFYIHGGEVLSSRWGESP